MPSSVEKNFILHCAAHTITWVLCLIVTTSLKKGIFPNSSHLRKITLLVGLQTSAALMESNIGPLKQLKADLLNVI